MKRDRCRGVAVIGMLQHGLNLCTEHYLEWIPRMAARAIKRFDMLTQNDCVLIAVSGGKDSLASWVLLYDLGYQTTGRYINLGIANDEYSQRSQECVVAFAPAHGGQPTSAGNLCAFWRLWTRAMERHA